jgi:hypothetical protein
MRSPRDRDHDLSLERLDDRGDVRRAYLGPSAQVRTREGAASTTERFSVAYQALIDAVFTAPGATQWLNRLRQRVAELVAGQEARQDAIRRAADPDTGWF